MQGGTEFYFIISGSVGIYVNAIPDEAQAAKLKELKAKEDAPKMADPIERFKSKFPGVGKYVPASNSTVFHKTDGYHVLYRDRVLLRVNKLEKGADFGAVALTENKPRNATILAESDCYFGILEKTQYNLLLAEHARKKFLALQNFVKSVPIFNGFLLKDIDTLLPEITTRRFAFREEIFREGCRLKTLFIVKTGSVKVRRDYPDFQAHGHPQPVDCRKRQRDLDT